MRVLFHNFSPSGPKYVQTGLHYAIGDHGDYGHGYGHGHGHGYGHGHGHGHGLGHLYGGYPGFYHR